MEATRSDRARSLLRQRLLCGDETQAAMQAEGTKETGRPRASGLEWKEKAEADTSGPEKGGGMTMGKGEN